MRAAYVSDRLHGLEPSWISAASGAVVALIGAVGVWLAQQAMGKAAFQNAINSGFKDLLDQVNQDREHLQKTLDRERLQSAAEIAQLRGEVINLTQVVEGLKGILRAHHIAVPESRQAQSLQGFHELPAAETTKPTT